MRVVPISRLPARWLAAPGVLFTQPDFVGVAQRIAARRAFRLVVVYAWVSAALFVAAVELGASVWGDLFLLACTIFQARSAFQIAEREIHGR